LTEKQTARVREYKRARKLLRKIKVVHVNYGGRVRCDRSGEVRNRDGYRCLVVEVLRTGRLPPRPTRFTSWRKAYGKRARKRIDLEYRQFKQLLVMREEQQWRIETERWRERAEEARRARLQKLTGIRRVDVDLVRVERSTKHRLRKLDKKRRKLVRKVNR
jgi:hypothetical protein